MLNVFSCACWPSVCLLWRNVYQGLLPMSITVFCPFFFLGFFGLLFWSCMSVCIFGELVPCQSCHVNIFSQSADCLFVLLMVSFAEQKLMSLIRSQWFTFLLSLLCWDTDLREHWYGLYQRMICLCSLLGVLWCHVLSLSL